MSDQKNLIVAIVASILILLGFQYFYELPRMEQQQRAQQAAPQQAPAPTTTPAPAQPGATAPQAPPVQGAPEAARPAVQSRAQVLAQSPRVPIENRRLNGSINLTGGRLDDLKLADYRVSVRPGSEQIVLLSPAGAPDAYYGEFGWSAAGNGVRLPDANTLWRQTAGTALAPGEPVTLSWDNGQGIRFHRTFAVDENYLFTVTQRVENTTDRPLTLHPFALVSRHGTPPTEGFYILHEGPLGVFRPAPGEDGTLREIGYSELAEAGTIQQASVGGWLGITDKYWLTALIPANDVRMEARFTHAARAGADRYQADFLGPALAVPSGGSAEFATRLFAGAKEVALIDRYEEQYSIARFDRTIDWGWFYFLTKPIFYVLDWFYHLLGNFGLAILALTVVVKLIFLPLAYKSYVSMSAMKKLQPEMMKMRERFGDDRARLQQEMMALYKKEKVNPAAGCLPILLQIPVFFALYKVLFVTIEMRHAPFYGWVHDLSAPDPTSILNLFGLLPYSVPDLGPLAILSIGVWPILMGASMWLQMRLNPQPPDPIQQRIFNLMPIMFTFMLGTFSAGLVIYWTWSNVLSIGQQWLIMKRMGVKHPAS